MKKVVTWFIAGALFSMTAVMVQAQGIRINDDTGTSNQWDPVIAMHPAGPAVIGWSDGRAGTYKAYMQHFTRRGLPFLNNRRVDDSEGELFVMDVAMDEHGQITILYEVNEGEDIRFRRFYANGVAKGSSRSVTTSGDLNMFPTMGMSPDGSFVVAWDRGSGNLFAKIFSPDGEEESGEIQVRSSADGSAWVPHTAMSENGDFMIVWTDARSGTPRIWGRLYDRTGNPKTDAFEVSDPAADGNSALYTPDIAAGKRGEYLIVWADDLRIWGRLVDANGNFVGAACPLCEDEFSLAAHPVVEAHPQEDQYCYAWIGEQASERKLMSNVFYPGAFNSLAGREIVSGTYIGDWAEMAVANGFNTIYAWIEEQSGNWDIYATWDGKKMPMRTTAASGFDGMVPISWDPPYAFTAVQPYHIHRINPDGSHEVIATVNPAERAIPNQMLDYVDHNVVNGETYQYAIQLDGEPEDQLYYTEAQPSADSRQHRLPGKWARTKPRIDGQFELAEWIEMSLWDPWVDVKNPEADRPVSLIVKNDSTHLYICVMDPNDDLLDPANLLGIVFDENRDGEWESSFTIGEGMLTLTNGAKSFTPFVGHYPNDLHFLSPQDAEAIDFVADVNTSDFGSFVVYECAIDLRSSPLNASPGDTIGFGIWIKDPGHFYAWGQGNAGEWPQGALWDAAESLGELVLAQKPKTEMVFFFERNAIQVETADLLAEGGEQLITLSVNENSGGLFPEKNGQVEIYQWEGDQFVSLFKTDPIDGEPSTLRVVDLDGDGRKDILFTCAGLKMLRNTAEGFVLSDLISSPLKRFVVVDLDQDGLLDIAAIQYEDPVSRFTVYHQTTGLHFDYIGALEGYEELVDLETINYNNDGYTDILCSSYNNKRVLLLHNNGTSLTPAFEYTLSGGIFDIEVADFDQDGYDDFAAGSDKIHVFRNTHDGHFEVAYETSGGSLGVFALQAVSLDEDHHPELLAEMFSDLVLFDYRGAMNFEELTDRKIPMQSLTRNIAAGDLNQNGLTDIVFGSNPVEVLFDAASYFGLPTAVVSKQEVVPVSFQLLQNYPNPFNPTTTIAFDLPRAANVELKVFDIHGREVATLVDQNYQPGRYTVQFDAGHLSSGVYFYRIRTGDFQQMRKMLLVR